MVTLWTRDDTVRHTIIGVTTIASSLVFLDQQSSFLSTSLDFMLVFGILKSSIYARYIA